MKTPAMSDYSVIDPATGQIVASYPTIRDDEWPSRVGRADETYRSWATSSSPQHRAELLMRVSELYQERRDTLARIIVREMGKPFEQARGEIDFCIEIYAYYAGAGADLLADEPLEVAGGRGSALLRRSALGVLLGIMPWNYPYYQVARFAAPNLLIGNTIVLKHAPQCPESAEAMEQVFIDAGFPAGAYVNIYATNEQVEEIIADPRIRGVSLTGSERAGAAVAATAGRHLKKVVLELGGSDPFLVLSTDDLDAVVQAGVEARLENTGQACNAAKRFIVVDRHYDAFVEKFTAAMQSAETAKSTPSEATLGPLSSTSAADRLDDQVQRAVQQGATLVTGGQRDGNFYSPTVLTGIASNNDAYREEFFGPVAAMYRVTSEEEAVELANDTPFGLGSYVFTTDPEQGLRVADAIDAGMVFINGVGAEGAELPFGGTKRSGFGRELGRLGVDEFVNKKLIRVVQ